MTIYTSIRIYLSPLDVMLFLRDQPVCEVLVEPLEPRGVAGDSLGVVGCKL